MKGIYNKETMGRGGTKTKFNLEFEIVGEARNKTCWKILHYGSKTPMNISKNFVKIIDEPVQQINPGEVI